MHRNTPPPRRVLVLAAHLLSETKHDDRGWRSVSDQAAVKTTGYSMRTVHLVWQELADMGAAEVGRTADGDSRLLRPLPHPLWAAANALRVTS